MKSTILKNKGEDPWQINSNVAPRAEKSRLSVEAEQSILRAIARIDYGSIEVVIHEGQVVQIECREKIRLARDETGRQNPIRPIPSRG
jgi:hypothetical protein